MARRPTKKTAHRGSADPSKGSEQIPAELVRRRKQFLLTEKVSKALEILAATIGTEQSLLVEDALRVALGIEPLPDADERRKP